MTPRTEARRPEAQGGNDIHRITRLRRKNRSLALLPVLALALLAAGCASITNPDGWAGPAPAPDGSVLYLTTDNGELSAVDPEDFSAIWIFPATEEILCADSTEARSVDLQGIYSTPQLDDSSVYIGAYDGNVYSLDREDGSCNWIFETDDPVVGGITLHDGRLYFGSDDSNLYVVDPATGDEIDRFEAGESVWVKPLIEDGILYVSTVGGDLHALDAESLDPVWDEPFSAKGGLLTDPVTAGDMILVGGIGETLYAVDMATGTERWSVGGSNWFWGTPLVDEEAGVIYAPNLDSNVYALTFDGSAAWPQAFQAENGVRSSPRLSADGETLLIIDRKGNVYGVDPENGSGLWPAPAQLNDTVLSDPLLLDDGLLIVGQGGDIFQMNADGSGLRRIEVRAT